MGAGQSVPTTLTHQKVFDLTRDTRGMMDVLLDYMLKEITVRDFLALSNPSECKKYVIFMANSLNKIFYELKIVPTKDKRGVIAFRPVKDLINPTPEMETQNQSLCLTIAYFYTRIFQIYGALALTLIDDSNVIVDSKLISYYNDKTKELLAPGYKPYITSGGAVPSPTLGNYNFLRSYLYDEQDSVKGYLTRYVGEGEAKGIVYFLPRLEEKNEFGRIIPINESKLQKGTFYIGYTGGKRYAALETSARIEGIGGNTVFSFGKFKYYKKDAENPTVIDIPNDLIPVKSIIVEREKPTESSAYVYSIKGSSKTITEFLNDNLIILVIYLKKLTEGEAAIKTNTTVLSESGTSEELRLSRIIYNLTKTKPLGHCIARAIQLLQTLPLKGEPAVSSICKAKFFEKTVVSSNGKKTTISRSGIPEPGSSLDTSPGLAALSQLFYDTVLIGSPKIVIGTKPGPKGEPSTMEQYIDFMKKMGRLFGDIRISSTTTLPSSDEIVKRGLKGIYNKRDGELCKTIDGNITIPPSQVNNVYSVVNNLYKIQLEHAAKCGSIFKLLFDIQRDKSTGGRYRISLSNNIIQKGFPEIERINYMARDVLVQYYSNCESKYLEGMKLVLENRSRTKPKVAPSPPHSTPSTPSA